MSKDTIYREDAIKVVRHTSMEFVDADTRQKLIEAIPSADRPSDPHDITYINALKNRIRELEAKRPQGEWKVVPPNAWEFNGIIQWHKCSVCKCRSMFISDYCPHCGARMKGADDE